TVLAAKLVPFVDFGPAHPFGALLLVLPVIMHQLPEQRRVSRNECTLAAVAQFLLVMQVSQHLLVMALGPHLLVLQDRAGAARESGEEKQQVVLEIEKRIHAD